MKKGCVIFAHDGSLDYGSQAVLAARLVRKHLNVPVSIITDSKTLKSIKKKFKKLPFDQIIKIDSPTNANLRRLSNGPNSRSTVEFINKNRNSVWELTPYDRTLVIDTDFLVLSDALTKFWNTNYSFMITPGMVDPIQIELDPKSYVINPYSINMLWATNIMFTKNEETKLVFELVEYIKDNYIYFATLYNFDSGQFRNDYAFSIACHIMSGEGQDPWHGELPCPILIRDVDQIASIKDNQITYILKDFSKTDNSLITRTVMQDVHVMNKFDLLKRLPDLLELTNE